MRARVMLRMADVSGGAWGKCWCYEAVCRQTRRRSRNFKDCRPHCSRSYNVAPVHFGLVLGLLRLSVVNGGCQAA